MITWRDHCTPEHVDSGCRPQALARLRSLGRNGVSQPGRPVVTDRPGFNMDWAHHTMEKIKTVNRMEWALWGLDYLLQARSAIRDDSKNLTRELREHANERAETWHKTCKNIVYILPSYSAEFVDDVLIPGKRYASPDVFEKEISQYKDFVQGMADELDRELQKYRAADREDDLPSFFTDVQRYVDNVMAAIDYVQTNKPPVPATDPVKSDVDLILGLAKRFHESVLSLNSHPHGGKIFTVQDEWDCQYLFRSILAAYFADVREEEWNPSVAGSSARCEFFLKTPRTMVELKFVRKATDARKIKSELATDFLDYGKNPQVSHIICLIYDPTHVLKNPSAMQTDLSGPINGMTSIDIIISPPRD